jgi:hypothetical protein
MFGIDSTLAAIIIIAVVVVIAWILLKFVFRLTMSIFRIGCAIIALLAIGAFVVWLLL